MTRRTIYIFALCAILSAAPIRVAAQSIMPDAIEQSDVPTVDIRHGAIVLKNHGIQTYNFHIYSITGQLIKRVTLSNGATATVELPQGCYIIKCEKWSKKIALS